jgi:hypothetical protein
MHYEVQTLRDNVNMSQGQIVAVALPAIIQALQGLFQGADPGHWQGGHFIPGDLASRQQTAATYISQFGVASVVDSNIIYNILTEVYPPQFASNNWQNTLQRYLNYLKTGLANGTIIPGQVTNPLIKEGAKVTGGGFQYNIASFGSLFPMLIVAGGGIYLLSQAFKKKRKK